VTQAQDEADILFP